MDIRDDGRLPAGLAGFAWYQTRRGTGFPLVPMSLFRQRSFVTGLVVTIVAFSTIGAIFLVLTVQMQAGHGFSALRTGLTFMAWPVGLLITAGLAVRRAATAGPRLVTAGLTLLTAAMIILIMTFRAAGPSPDPASTVDDRDDLHRLCSRTARTM